MVPNWDTVDQSRGALGSSVSRAFAFRANRKTRDSATGINRTRNKHLYCYQNNDTHLSVTLK